MTNTEIIIGPDGKKYRKKIVPITLEQLLISQEANAQVKQAPLVPEAMPQMYQPSPRPAFHPQQPFPQQRMPQSEANPLPMMKEPGVTTHRKNRMAKIALITSAALVVGGGTAVSYAHGFDFTHIGSWFSNSNETPQNFANGLSSETKQTGPESFDSAVCTNPAEVAAVAEVSGRMALAPEVTTAASSTLSMLPKYMTAANEAKITSKFVTDSGYNEASLNEMPLALTICELTPAITQNAQTGTYTIDCSSLVLRFEDPYQLYNEKSFPFTSQEKGANVTIKNHALGGYMSLPYDKNHLFLSNGSDATENKSLATLLSAMDTPTQEQGIMDEMETKVVPLIKLGVNTGDITISGTDKQDFQTFINNIIMKRLGTTNVIFNGLYNVQSYVPNAAVTQLSPNEPFKLTSIILSDGNGLLPKPTASPTPTPSPTATPKPQVTNAP